MVDTEDIFEKGIERTETSVQKSWTSRNANMMLKIALSGSTILMSNFEASSEERDSESELIEHLIVKNNNDYIVDLEEIYGNSPSVIDFLNSDGEQGISKKEIYETILSFKSLQPSWDGFGAFPLEVKAAANALEIIDTIRDAELRKISELFPNPNGTITISWSNEMEEELSVEIGNNAMSYYLVTNSDEPLFFNINQITGSEIKKMVEAVEKL